MSTSMSPVQAVLKRYSPEQLRLAISRMDPNDRQEFADILEADERQRAEQVALEEQQRIWKLIEKKEPRWDAGPLLWLTQYTKTEDTHALAKNTEFRVPFPKKSYIQVLFDYFLWEQCKLPHASAALFVLKTREMIFSWSACGYIGWLCEFQNAFCVGQSGKQEKGQELISYASTLYRNQPDWMKARNPLVVENSMELRWQNGGRFLAIPSGVDQARMYHPHLYFQDESSFLPEAEASFNAVRPVVRQAICGSTDEISWFHSECKGDV